MIAGNEETMVVILTAIKETREGLDEVKKLPEGSHYQVTKFSDVTKEELQVILETRLARLNSAAQCLGIYGPGARDSAKASAMALIHSNNPRPTQ